jgi:putative membrane-bound dehydrogenase-like protein
MKNASRALIALIVLFASSLIVDNALADEPALKLVDGDHICLIGNSLGERLQHFPDWEAELQARFPTLQLAVRNLCFSGDEPLFRPRSENFGSPDDHLTHSRASVVLAFFGFNESFAAEKGVEQFRSNLSETVGHMLARNYSGKGAPRIVLISPIAAESLPSLTLFDAPKVNANLKLYSEAIRQVAMDRRIGFVDVFTPTLALLAADDQLTINGVHLNAAGHEKFATILNDGLFGEAPGPRPTAPALRAEIDDKNFHWFNRYRAVDGYYIYGGRSRLEFEPDKTLTNAVVLERERAILDQMVANRDQRIWRVAQGQPVPPAVDDSNTEPFIPVASNYGGAQVGKEGNLTYLSPAEALQQFEIAEGFELNCFASEQDFPELANPVQFVFDGRDRMWVTVMPSYPQWQPKSPMNDKVLILDDTDQDGKADRCTVFADKLHVPTGIELGHGGVFVAQQPDLMFLRDTDGDDIADERQRILHGFDSGDTHHAIGCFLWGPDGGLYMLEGTFHHTAVETPYGPVRNAHGGVYRFDPRTWKFETHVHYNFANPWGITFDPWGQNFVADASGGANYFATAFSGNVVPFTGQDDYGPFKYKYRREMKQFIVKRFRPTAGCEFVSSRHFPDDMQGHFLLNNCIGEQGVYEHVVEDDGSGFSATEIRPLFRAKDRNFRPVALQFGPDGALYVCDWHNALVGHMQHHIRDPHRDHEHGRIWRLTAKDHPLLTPPRIDGQSTAQLLDLLKEFEDRVRYRTRRELCQRDTVDVMAALKAWLAKLDSQDSNLEHHLLEALWVCQQHNVVDRELLNRVLNSPDARARAAATRVVCYWRDQLPDALELLRERAADKHPRVRLEVVRACSFFTDRAEEAAELALSVIPNGDYYLEYTLKETVDVLERYVN